MCCHPTIPLSKCRNSRGGWNTPASDPISELGQPICLNLLPLLADKTRERILLFARSPMPGPNGHPAGVLGAFPSVPGWGLARPEPRQAAEPPPSVLVVDSLEINRQILRSTLRSEGYQLLETLSAAGAFDILDRAKVDLVILDLVMPEISGLDFCRLMKASRNTHLIPVLILTSVQGVENEIAGIASGADEFLFKPVHPVVVRTRVAAMLRHKAAVDSLEEVEAILFALAQAIEQRDRATSGHCERLGAIGQALGTALGLSRSQMLALHRGAFLHDIGKVSVPDAILFKADSLSQAEWAIMRTHTARGEEICRPMKSLRAVLPIIRSHHERWDGSGYPDGLAGEQIPLLARILQVADIFEALTSARPYKDALSAPEAFEVLEQETRLGWRDPDLVRLLRETAETSPGSPGAQALFPWSPVTAIEQSLQNMQIALLK